MYKKILKWLAKIGLTVLAFYLLSKKIEWPEVKEIISGSSLVLLFVALLLYILSKVCSAFRLNHLWRAINVNISEKQNIKLYFIGMFYNLFLPGGIGGDGYKAYYVKKTNDVSTRKTVAALFLDRFFGLAALFILFFSGLLFTQFFSGMPAYFRPISVLLLVLVIPVTFFTVRFFFSSFLSAFWKALTWSFIIQLIQIIEAICILKAIGIHSEYLNYLVLFLASSIASVLPVSIGGVGLRELTFVYGNEYLSIQNNEAVAFTLLFFVLTAISSFIGAFLSMEKK